VRITLDITPGDLELFAPQLREQVLDSASANLKREDARIARQQKLIEWQQQKLKQDVENFRHWESLLEQEGRPVRTAMEPRMARVR
jgi:hypothetical protein